MKSPFLSILFILTISPLFAQIGGNQVYQNQTNRQPKKVVNNRSIQSTDSTLVVSARVLLNKKADEYIISIGVSQGAKTVTESNQQINTRIENVMKQLSKVGIKKEAIYVDFISETKVYDHKIDGKTIEEIFQGFEIRKNLMIKTKDLAVIDQIIEICATQEIYDIIKVEYRNTDLEAIDELLFEEALTVIERKKKKFMRGSSVNFGDRYRIISENMSIYYPKNMYSQYDEAFESSLITTSYSSSYIKKQARKERTYYYDSIDTNIGIDKVIDEITPEVGIQYLMEIQTIFELEKD